MQNKMNTVLLGSRLKQLRINAGMTMKELAEKLHVTPSAIYGYECGKNYPGIDVLCGYQRVFNADLNRLLSTETYGNTVLMDQDPKDQEMIDQYRMLSEEEKDPLRQLVKIMYVSHFQYDQE